VLVRPILPGGSALGVERFGWLPLIAGLAMTRAVDSLIDRDRVHLKWPNDVLVDGRKIAGLLAELVPGRAVVLGAGLNLSMTEAELPVPTATSLSLCGATMQGEELVDLALSGYLSELKALIDQFLARDADAASSGILALVSARCGTIGSEVRVELPSGEKLRGVATGIDVSGRLLVSRAVDGVEQAVAAGDVTHLRYE
jgi:BirA family biotin operon repressor/biotin-[acetyl-CoA-carboxylase] ligase